MPRRLATIALLLVAVAGFTLYARPQSAPAAAGTPATDARRLPDDAAVLSIIKARVESKRSAGIVVGLLDFAGKPRVVAYGDPGPGKPALDGDSVFEIGSISKVFSGTLLAILAGEGKVRLDDPVSKYLPATVKVPSRNNIVITLAHLAEQNSGLPRMPNNFTPKDPANPYADYTAEQMFAFLSKYELTRNPGEQFEYSNLGVGLLGQALARSQNMSYEALVDSRIFKPLGMTHSAIILTPWMQQHLALGHDATGRVTANWDIPAFAGAGAIRSTANDMLKFLDANLHLERGPLREAMKFAQTRRAPTSPPNGSIGLNWLHRKVNADTVIWHNGGTGGYRTFIGFDPDRKLGVVLLTNSGGAGSDDIGFHLVNPNIPLATVGGTAR